MDSCGVTPLVPGWQGDIMARQTTMKTQLVRILAALGVGLLLARCGGNPTDVDPPVVPVSGSCPTRNATRVDALALERVTRKVFLGVGQSARGPQLGHSASVFNVVAEASGERCSSVMDGHCMVRDCRPSADRIGDMGTALQGWNLGRVAVRDRILPTADVFSLAPRSNGTYERPEGVMGLRWREGDEICVSTTGGVVRAFQVSVTFPSSMRYLGPTVDDPINQIVYIDRSAPLALRWEPTADRVVATLNQRPANGDTPVWLEELTALCSFDGSVGAGVIPPSVLARFLSSPEGNSSGSLSVVTQRQSPVQVGDRLVLVTASAGVSLRAEFR